MSRNTRYDKRKMEARNNKIFGTYSLLLASKLLRLNSSKVTPLACSHSILSCSNAFLRSSNSRTCNSRAWKCQLIFTEFDSNFLLSSLKNTIKISIVPSYAPHVFVLIQAQNLSTFVFSLWPSSQRLVPSRPPFSSSSPHAHVFLPPFEPKDS